MGKLFKNVKWGVLCLGLILATTTHTWAQAKKTLLFGVVPQQSASRLVQIWLPFMKALSEQSGYDIKFATMKDIPSFEECLAQGAYDIAYMNPYHYTIYSQSPGYSAFAHQIDKKLKGILVTRADSDIADLKDLNGAEIAFPSPAAFGASVLPRAEMNQRGIQFTPRYVSSHDSVYRAVATGLMPAGGGVERTLAKVSGEIRDQLKVIYVTQGYTPHAFAFGPQVHADDRWRLEAAFNNLMHTAPDTYKLLGMRGVEIAADQDWDQVRDLNLTLDQTEIRKEGSLTCRFD